MRKQQWHRLDCHLQPTIRSGLWLSDYGGHRLETGRHGSLIGYREQSTGEYRPSRT